MNAPTTASSHTHMGTPPPGYHQEWAKHTVHCHGFANLSAERGARVYSPEFMLLWNQLRLEICPGGDASSDVGMVSLYLNNRSDEVIDVDFGFGVNNGNGKQVEHNRSARLYHFDPVGVATHRWGFTNFATDRKSAV